MGWFRLKACAKCRGDLVLDEGDWLCLQCGTYLYTGLYRHTLPDRRPQWAPPEPRRDKGQARAGVLAALSPGSGVLTGLAEQAGVAHAAMSVSTAWRP